MGSGICDRAAAGKKREKRRKEKEKRKVKRSDKKIKAEEKGREEVKKQMRAIERGANGQTLIFLSQGN